MKIFVASYLNEKESLIGGVRGTRLNEFFNIKGINSKLITRNGINENEISIPEITSTLGKFYHRIFYPDYSLDWCKAVVPKIKSRVLNNILITTGPPHGIHWMGLKLKKKIDGNFLWVSDFRDPFVDNPFYNRIFLKRYLDLSFEKKVLLKSDVIIFNTEYNRNESIRKIAMNLRKDIEDKSIVVRNGFDEYSSIDMKKKERNGFVYSGGIYKGLALNSISCSLKKLKPEHIFSCDFYGEYSDEFKKYNNLKYIKKVDSKDIPNILSNYKYGIIWLPKEFQNSGRVAAKLYDYIGAGVIPICINPSIEMKKIISQLGYGYCIDEGNSNDDFCLEKYNGENEIINIKERGSFERNKQFEILFERIKAICSS